MNIECSICTKGVLDDKASPRREDSLRRRAVLRGHADGTAPVGQDYAGAVRVRRPPVRVAGAARRADLERDVRSILQVGDLEAFGRFLRLAAGRNGQLLDLSSLASDCGISHSTAKRWLSVLEASFLVALLRPHFRNFGKRLIKSPKLYFLDTGLLCHLRLPDRTRRGADPGRGQVGRDPGRRLPGGPQVLARAERPAGGPCCAGLRRRPGLPPRRGGRPALVRAVGRAPGSDRGWKSGRMGRRQARLGPQSSPNLPSFQPSNSLVGCWVLNGPRGCSG